MERPQVEKRKAKPKTDQIKDKIFRHKTTDNKYEHKDQDTSNGIQSNKEQVQ